MNLNNESGKRRTREIVTGKEGLYNGKPPSIILQRISLLKRVCLHLYRHVRV